MDAQLDEDAIDLQDLQAQIDLSMSFAQNLVTSWVKPTQYSQTSRQNDLENEIKEYMRRPTRLGVGAPIPESQSLVREAARLKTKLEGGKKRQREEEGIGTKKPQSDDEEESRPGAIKKKARVDPFSTLSKKEKNKGTRDSGKNGPTIHPVALKAMPSSQSLPPAIEDGLEVDEVAKELLLVPDTPETPRKEADYISQQDSNRDGEQGTKRADLSDVGINPPPHTSSSSPLKPTAPDASLPPAQTPATPPVSLRNLVDVSLTANLPPSPGDRRGDSNFLKLPLLNLRGSVSERGSEIEEAGSSGLVPKKKRKRRKKKKSQPNMESTSAFN